MGVGEVEDGVWWGWGVGGAGREGVISSPVPQSGNSLPIEEPQVFGGTNESGNC